MTFLERLDKAVTFSWKPAGVQRVEEITRRLIHESRLSPEFQAPPKSEAAVQAIALPVLIAQVHGNYRLMNENSPWRTKLPKEERRFIADKMGFTVDDRHVLFLVNKRSRIDTAAAYIAASFAFTARVVPMVISYSDMIQTVYESALNRGDSYEEIKQAGMLIVTMPFGRYTGAEKADGGMANLMQERCRIGNMTVFLDVPPNWVLKKLAQGKLLDTDDVEKMVSETQAGDTRMQYYLAGPETYCCYNSRFMGW